MARIPSHQKDLSDLKRASPARSQRSASLGHLSGDADPFSVNESDLFYGGAGGEDYDSHHASIADWKEIRDIFEQSGFNAGGKSTTVIAELDAAELEFSGQEQA